MEDIGKTYYTIVEKYLYDNRENESPLIQKIKTNESIMLVFNDLSNAKIFLRQVRDKNEISNFSIKKIDESYIKKILSEFQEINHSLLIKILDE